MVVCAGIVIACLMKRRCRSILKKRNVWVRSWVKNHQKFDVYHQLVRELRLADEASYTNFLRMDISTFDELLGLVSPLIRYKDTNMWCAIPPGERLAVTLRFLATGKSDNDNDDMALSMHVFYT